MAAALSAARSGAPYAGGRYVEVKYSSRKIMLCVVVVLQFGGLGSLFPSRYRHIAESCEALFTLATALGRGQGARARECGAERVYTHFTTTRHRALETSG
jgi:hypothetical protein